MTRIWKFPLKLIERQVISVPANAKALTVQMQLNGGDEIPTVWMQVDPDAPTGPRTFTIVGTGHPVPDNAGEYLGTVQELGFVWHVYERRGA
jgi:hypothetical protein